MQLVLAYLAPFRSETREIPCKVDSAINLDLNNNNGRSNTPAPGSRPTERALGCECDTNGKGSPARFLPAWMMSLAHSLHGNKATYMLQPFTSAEFLFMMAFSSAWHTAKEKTRPGL